MRELNITQQFGNDNIKELQSHFPAAKKNSNRISLNSDKEYIHYSVYNKFKNFEVIILDAKFATDIRINVMPSNSDTVVVRFLLDSSIQYENYQTHVGEGFTKGAALYNSYSEHSLILKANQSVKWLTILIPFKFYTYYTDSQWPQLDELVQQKKKWMIFESLTPQMNNALKDIFHFQTLTHGRVGLSIAKGLELATLFFVQILKRNSDSENIGIPDVEIKLMFKIKHYLTQDLSISPELKELSSRFGLNETKLRANFKKVFGMPPHQFLLREKLNEAHRLLSVSNESINTIALNLGFSDSSHFTRSFKKAFGYLPKDLR